MSTPPLTPAIAGNPPPSTDIQTLRPFVAFKPDNVPPSQLVYLQLNDSLSSLFLSNTAGLNLIFRYRYLTPQGEIKEGAIPWNTVVGIDTGPLPLGECWLLSFTLQATTPLPAGAWIFGQIGLNRTQPPFTLPLMQGLLWQGFIPYNAAVGWPGTPTKDVSDGAGTIRSITGTAPGAGVDISEVCPSNRRWQLLMFRASLTSSATVANRLVNIILDDGTNMLYRLTANTNQPASQTNGYNVASGIPNAFDGAVDIGTTLPQPTIIKAGCRIKTSTTNLQAGDQWTAPQYLVIEWGLWDS